jgi:hypothetical protein
MTFLTFIERVAIPTVIAIALAGGIAGLALGCALVVNHAATLRFAACMNRWVSTREAFAPLDRPISLEPAVAADGRRPLLGTFLVVAGILAVYFLIVRLDFRHVHYVPGVDLKRLLASGIALETMKWVLVAGSAFAAIIGALMLAAPQRMLTIERRLNAWHSSDRLVVATERMRTPLEPRVEAYPRTSGGIIAIASLFVVLAMIGLLVTRFH